MPIRKPIVAILSTALLIIASSSVASANVKLGPGVLHGGGGDHHEGEDRNGTQVIHETVSWTLSPDVCTSIPAAITGTGQRELQIETQPKRDGSIHRVSEDVVKGTATDGRTTYRFVYRNHFVEDIPASGAPIQAHMADSFKLTSPGATALDIAFDWQWTYSPPSASWPPESNLRKKFTRGDLNCDPI